jgi:hypothetical protein
MSLTTAKNQGVSPVARDGGDGQEKVTVIAMPVEGELTSATGVTGEIRETSTRARRRKLTKRNFLSQLAYIPVVKKERSRRTE